MTRTQRTLVFASQSQLLCSSSYCATASLCLESAGARDQPPTDAQKDACMQDVFRLCSTHIRDRTAITACVRAKQASLRHQCRDVISIGDTAKEKTETRSEVLRTILHPRSPPAALPKPSRKVIIARWVADSLSTKASESIESGPTARK